MLQDRLFVACLSAVGDGQPTSSLDGFGEQSLRAVEGTQKQFETALKDLLGSLGKKLSSNDSAMGHDALRFLLVYFGLLEFRVRRFVPFILAVWQFH